MRRQGGVALAAAVLLVGVAGLSAAADRPSCGVSRPDGWVSLPQPSGLSGVSIVSPSPASSRRLVATDGAVVVVSTNGGCGWTQVYQPSLRSSVSSGQDAGSGGVTQLLVEGAAGAETAWIGQQPVTNAVLVTSRLEVGPLEGPYTQATGLPPAGRIRFGLGADGRHGYAVAESPTGADATIYATADGGRSWTAGGTTATGTVTDVEVDPRDPRRAYVLGSAGLFRTEDAGATAHRLPGATPTAVTAATDGLTVFVDGQSRSSRDGGRTFASQPAPAGVLSADSRGSALVISTRFGDFGRSPSGPYVAFTPDRLLARDPKLAVGQSPAVVAHSGSAVLLFPLVNGYRRTLPPAAPVHVPTLRNAPRAQVARPTLTPARIAVSLGPGGRTTVPYAFRTPPRPGPLDVYFLVDTTASMESALNGLRQSIQTIIDSLAATGLDVQFGVGDFRDVDQLVSNPLTGYVYRRDQPIAPPGDGLARALANLQTSNGTDIPEAQTIALEQAATGAGMPGLVPAGQDAGFRPGSTRVVVLVTDSPFHQDPPYPSMAQAVDALSNVQARVLGIAVATNLGASDPRPDEKAAATGTGTFAPPGGIDCDGDGETDVAGGAPAVCEAHDGIGGLTNVGDPILSLLDSVQVPGDIGVAVSGHAVRGTAGSLVRSVDLSKPSALPFSVTYGCDKTDAGKRFPATVTGRIGSSDVVIGTAEVRCLAIAPRPKPAIAPAEVLTPLAPVVVTALPPPPPPPPPPLPPPAQLPNANPNVNPNVQPNINPAAAAERQQQLQVVLAQQEAQYEDQQLDVAGDETELAMSARPRREEQAAAGLLGGMMLLSALTAVAVVRRHRVQLAR